MADGLRLDADTLLRVRGVFEEEMERGRKDQPSSLQMENTFVPELIDGTGQHHLLSYQICHVPRSPQVRNRGGRRRIHPPPPLSHRRRSRWSPPVPSQLNHSLSEVSVLVLISNLLYFPTRIETGRFLALDLGGTNFRVMVLDLKDGRVVDESITFYHVDEHLRIGCGYRLFDYLAECIADFVHKQGLGSERLPLGEC